jgi:hypothetical protein
MVSKWIKTILLLMGVVLLVLIAKNIQKPFWNDQNYTETVSNFQRNQDILPYSLRVVWWNKSVILVSIVERTISVVWAGDYFYLPMLCLLILVKKRRWLNLGLIVIGLALIAIEKDPNPGKYLLWLSPLVISGFIR